MLMYRLYLLICVCVQVSRAWVKVVDDVLTYTQLFACSLLLFFLVVMQQSWSSSWAIPRVCIHFSSEYERQNKLSGTMLSSLPPRPAALGHGLCERQNKLSGSMLNSLPPRLAALCHGLCERQNKLSGSMLSSLPPRLAALCHGDIWAV